MDPYSPMSVADEDPDPFSLPVSAGLTSPPPSRFTSPPVSPLRAPSAPSAGPSTLFASRSSPFRLEPSDSLLAGRRDRPSRLAGSLAAESRAGGGHQGPPSARRLARSPTASLSPPRAAGVVAWAPSPPRTGAPGPLSRASGSLSGIGPTSLLGLLGGTRYEPQSWDDSIALAQPGPRTATTLDNSQLP